MRFFDSTISKVDADFAFAQFHDHGQITYSVACSANSLNCDCWETGPQAFDSNHFDFFSLPGGLGGVEEQLDFYYNFGSDHWWVYIHNGDGNEVGSCNYNSDNIYECGGVSAYYCENLYCSSNICE
jgi:hypothetical protein